MRLAVLAVALCGCATPAPRAPVSCPVDTAAGRMLSAYGAVCDMGCPAVTMRPLGGEGFGCATLYEHTAEIRYDPADLAGLRAVCGDAAIAGVFAHELGHAIDYAMSTTLENNWAAELRAEQWAGCLLARADVETTGYECFISREARFATDSHPGGAERVDAVRAGHRACLGARIASGGPPLARPASP